MMQQVIKSLPDDKPITVICIVEDLTKIPTGYTVVSRTHDQDSDADLWRGSTFFGGKISRYLCISKTKGFGDYIVESLSVIGEKDQPPDGYCSVPKTIDTDAKAWKKRQICYRLSKRNVASTAISDVILLNKGNRAPEGFDLVGTVNGLSVGIKKVALHSDSTSPGPQLAYSLNPNGLPLPGSTSQKTQNGIYPQMIIGGNNKDGKFIYPSPKSSSLLGGDDYVNLLVPQRPAPAPPHQLPSPTTANLINPLVPPPRPPPPSSRVQHQIPNIYGTLTQHHGLEGIPFVLHPSLQLLSEKQPLFQISCIKVKVKTKEQIDKEFNYDFRLEREST